MRLPAGSRMLPPVGLAAGDGAMVACASSDGHLLIFPLAELPTLARGKGQKLLQIPAQRLKSRAEVMQSLVVLVPGADLRVHAGNRHLTLKAADQALYTGERARRGLKLPRGFQRVDRLEAVE